MTQSVDLANAINSFVKGCKTDGTWDAIKACCIMAAWDGLTGALYPLKGPAPTNNNFVAGDYNRETGLKGDASTKYLDSNRSQNADPQNNFHCFVNVTSADTRYATLSNMAYIGASNAANTSRVGIGPYSGVLYFNNRSGASSSGLAGNLIGGMGASRSTSTGYSIRLGSSNGSITASSVTPDSTTLVVFGLNTPSGLTSDTDARLTFYSIGESLDLALLDNRVSTLMTDIGAAIP